MNPLSRRSLGQYKTVEAGYRGIVKLLLNSNADVNILRSRCGTVFRQTGKVSIVQLLLCQGVEINLECGVLGADRMGEHKILQLQVADVNMIDEGCPSTHGPSIADGCGQLDDGVRVPFIGPPTALQNAAALGRDNVVRLVIDNGNGMAMS